MIIVVHYKNDLHPSFPFLIRSIVVGEEGEEEEAGEERRRERREA
jgi:hypothetical protein